MSTATNNLRQGQQRRPTATARPTAPEPGSLEFIRPLQDVRVAVREFKRVFIGRTDVYALQQTDGSYRPVRQPLSDEALSSHLQGRITIGLYLIQPVADTTDMTVIDVDQKSKSTATALIAAAHGLSVRDDEMLLEASGNKGFHMWLLFHEKLPAGVALAFGRLLCERAGILGQVEIFPKQAHVPADGFGNLIKLPGRHAKSGRYSKFFSVDFQPLDFNCLRRVKRIGSQRILAMLEEAGAADAPLPSPSNGVPLRHGNIPCISQLWAGVEAGKRNAAAFRLAIYLKDQGLPVEIAAGALESWNVHNRPPLDANELSTTISQVYRRDYHGFGCQDPQMQEFCDAEACPVARARQRPAIPTRTARSAATDQGDQHENPPA